METESQNETSGGKKCQKKKVKWAETSNRLLHF